MTPAYIAKLDLTIQKIIIEIQKIDSIVLETFNMILARLSLLNNLKRIWFFDKTFLFADISITIISKTLFLLFNNANVKFSKKLEKLI